MRYARIYPWRRTRRFRAPSNGPEAFFVAQFSAGYTTNMFGFDLRQGQDKEPAIIVRKPDATMQPAPQDIQLMSKHRVLSLKPNYDLNGEARTARAKQSSPIISPA
jgi:hypothetical protein